MGSVAKARHVGARMNGRVAGVLALCLIACGGGNKRAESLPPPEYEPVSLPAYEPPRRPDPLDALESTEAPESASGPESPVLPPPPDEVLVPPAEGSSPSSPTISSSSPAEPPSNAADAAGPPSAP